MDCKLVGSWAPDAAGAGEWEVATSTLEELGEFAAAQGKSRGLKRRLAAVIAAEEEEQAKRQRAVEKQRMLQLMPRRRSGRIRVVAQQVWQPTSAICSAFSRPPVVARHPHTQAEAKAQREAAEEEARRAAERAACVSRERVGETTLSR